VASPATERALAPREIELGVNAGGGSGNGASAQEIPAGTNDDVVARRLRRAAEQESDPELKAKLWQEYVAYQKNLAKR
jgi:hypothetical protein